ncbi:ACT domain-containing protein [Pseudoxanthomonas koreensis]|uniref:ACT domain-containing protein n=1 Tax=Pseudoxanthomonas koreensis TaxID=266061 RepID=UPI0035A627C3
MRYRLDLVLKPVEGALVRVIGMTERRGFAPRAISGGTDGDDGRWRLQLVVDGSRPAETLKRQLQKVYDCEAVDIVALEDAAAAEAVQ